MLPKTRRLTRADIVAVVKTGRAVAADGLTLKFRTIPGGETSRFALVLVGQSSVTAARRNLLKRRARHALRRHLDAAHPGFAGVLLISKEWQDKKFVELEEKIVFLLRRARILP